MKKIVYIDVGNQLSYRPCFKRGTGLILGGSMLAGVLGSVGSSAISAAGQNSVNNKQMNFVANENQKNRDWQSEEAERARRVAMEQWFMQFGAQNEQWYKQQDYSQSLWRQQQDYLNAYNSPQEQVRRLKEAGLNPSLAIGDAGNAGGLAPATSTNVSSPPVSPVTASPVGNSTISLGNPSQYFAQGFMQSFQSFANGFKQLVTAGPEGQKLGAEAQRAVSDMFVNEREAEQLELKNFILSQTKDARIKKVFSELEDVNTGIWLKKLNGELTQAQIDKVLQETMFGFAQEALAYAQTDQIRQAMFYYFDNLQAQWKYWGSLGSAAQISSSAQMVNAQATRAWLEKRGVTEDAIRPLLVDSMALQNDLTSWKAKGEKVETFFRQKTVQARISSEIDKAYQMKLITKIEVQNLRKAIADGDWAQIEHMMNALQKVASSYRDIGIGNNANVDAATSILNMPIP